MIKESEEKMEFTTEKENILKKLTMEEAMELYETTGVIIVCNDGKVVNIMA